MNRRTLVTCIVLALFTTGTSRLGVAQPRPIWERLGDPKLRRGVAEDYRKAFLALDKQIPTLSPDEDRWLRTEIDDTKREAGGFLTARAVAAMDSRAYSLRVAKPHVKEVIEILNEIIAYPAPGQRGEVRLWAQLAVLFMDGDFWQQIDALVSRGIVDKKIDGVEDLYFENHVLEAGEILRYVVIPAL